MTLFNRSSIRTKLKLAILSTTFLSVALVFAGFFVYEQITYDDILVKDLSTKADIIAENSDAALAFGNSIDAEQVLKSLSTQPHIVTAAIYNHDGKLFATYRREGRQDSIPLTPIGDGSWYEKNTLVLSKPIILNREKIGTIYINTDLLGRDEHFRSYIGIALLMLLGSLTVAFIVATMLEKNISRPILSLASTTQQVSERKDYSIRATKVSDDETGFLADAVNQMLAQIQERDDNLRRAHDELELRVKARTVDLVRANEELQKRDVQLSTAQQIASLGSWEWDLHTSQITWSEELYRIYGRRQDEFGRTFESLLEYSHPEDRSSTHDLIQESIRTHQPFDFEERIIRPDGSVRMLHSQGRVVKDEDGQVVKLLGVCLDVTDRKRAEEKFRGLLESAPDAMIIAQQDGRIVLVNAQTERLFGYSRSELLGQQVEMLLPKRFHRVQNYFITPSTLQLDEGLELYGLRKNNTEFPVEVSLSPLETEDGMLVSSAIRDITEQRRLQSRLLAAERQRSADLRRYTRSVQRVQEEERQRIARELHDDLCQRLSGMKLNVEVIADEVRTKDRTLHRRLQSFNKQCEEMIIEVRRMSVNLRPAVLDDFGLSIALGLLTRDFEKLHKIPVNLEMDESARLQLDPQLEIALYRIAQEALSNVAKHAHASMVTVALQKNREVVILRISDNGKGLNPDEGPRKDALHGLGLIGMRERTGLFGGTFTIESTQHGTTVTVTIPLTIGVRNEEDAPSYS